MIKRLISQRIRLGLFVLTGTLALVLGLYYVGSQRNIFHATIRVCADFKNVDGLMPGNNVRFNGVDVGTVLDIEPNSDTTVHVEFSVAEGFVQKISVNAIASIGTDGLLGNKLLNLSPGMPFDRSVREFECLKTRELPAMDAAMRTLNETNDNLLIVSRDLIGVSQKLARDNALWQLLSDSTLNDRVRGSLVRIQKFSENSAVISGDIKEIVGDIKAGRGTVGALITDSTLFDGLSQSVVKLNLIGDSLLLASGNIKGFAANLNNGNGTMAALINDTLLVHDINNAVRSIHGAANSLDENLRLLKQSRLLKRYARRLEVKN